MALRTSLKEIRSSSILDAEPEFVESVLCVKHGAQVVCELREMLLGLPSVMKETDRKSFVDDIFQRLALRYSTDEQIKIDRALSSGKNDRNTQLAEKVFLALWEGKEKGWEGNEMGKKEG